MESTKDRAVFDRLLDPLARSFTPEMAKVLVDYRADRPTQALLDKLAEKANEGTLSPEEHAQYESYVRAIDLIAILQAKARKVLANHPNG